MAPLQEQLLLLSARENRPAPAKPVCSLSRGWRLVVPLVRVLPVPSDFGLLAASLSFVAEPTSFATEPRARAALVHRFLASTPPVSGGTGTCRHRTPAHP